MKKKKLLRTFASLALVGALFASPIASGTACAYKLEDGSEIYASKTVNNQTVSHLLNEGSAGKTVILHTTDVHGALIKLPYVTALENKLKDQGADVVLIDGGDFSYAKEHKEKPDAPEEYEYINNNNGLSAVTVMNAMGYDYVTIGNHEYENKLASLEEILTNANFTRISANVFKKDTGKAAYTERVLYGIDDDSKVKIGFFGLTAPETESKKAGNHEVKEKQEMFDCGKNQIDKLLHDGADIIIPITHLGLKTKSNRSSLTGNRSIDFYNDVKNDARYNGKNPIDLILDGHAHVVVTSGEEGEPILAGGIRLDALDVVVIDNSTKKIQDSFVIKLADLENGIQPDENILNLVNAIRENKINVGEFTAMQHDAFVNGQPLPTVDKDGNIVSAETDDDKDDETTETDPQDDATLDETTDTGDDVITEEPTENDGTDATIEEPDDSEGSQTDDDKDSDKKNPFDRHSHHGSGRDNSRHNNRWGSHRHHH
ncbi:MAG: hypothetical protein K6D38_02965 [Pseudobutyrivibrio sp.]|nr:hypothetical protein [Pseudobutyrivibrio sp.]